MPVLLPSYRKQHRGLSFLLEDVLNQLFKIVPDINVFTVIIDNCIPSSLIWLLHMKILHQCYHIPQFPLMTVGLFLCFYINVIRHELL